jgi:hypothetical protein
MKRSLLAIAAAVVALAAGAPSAFADSIAYVKDGNVWLSTPDGSRQFQVTTINEGGTGYSHADRLTGWDEPGFGKHSGWRHPAWVDNDTVLLGDPTHAINYDVILDTLSDGTNGNLVHNWFSDMAEDNPATTQGDITRDRSKLAFDTGENDSTLTLYWVPSFPTSFPDGESLPADRPHPCYRYSNPPGGSFSQPTFSPDGGAVAYAAGDGVHVAAVPSFAAGCTLDGATPNPPLVIPGATEPDWGPAGVPAGRPAPGGDGGGTPTPAPAARLSVKALHAPRGAVRLRITPPSAGRLTVTAKHARKVSRVVSRAVTVTLRVRGHARKVTVKVAFRPVGAAPLRASVTAKVRR